VHSSCVPAFDDGPRRTPETENEEEVSACSSQRTGGYDSKTETVVVSRSRVAGLEPHTYFDVVGNNGNILEVQRSINLIHDVQRGWFEMVQRKHKRQGAQGFLTTCSSKTKPWKTHTMLTSEHQERVSAQCEQYEYRT